MLLSGLSYLPRLSIDGYVVTGELLCMAGCALTVMIVTVLLGKMKARTVVAGGDDTSRNTVTIRQYVMTRRVKLFLQVAAALLGLLAVVALCLSASSIFLLSKLEP